MHHGLLDRGAGNNYHLVVNSSIESDSFTMMPFDARMKFVVPLSCPAAAENPQGRYGVGIQLFGRLKPGVTARQADAEAKTLEKRYVDA